MASTACPRRSACSRTEPSSSMIVSGARPLPSRWVRTRCSTSTAPSRVTAPAAVVVPPTSTPSRSASRVIRVGGGLYGPLRGLPQDGIAPAKPALEDAEPESRWARAIRRRPPQRRPKSQSVIPSAMAAERAAAVPTPTSSVSRWRAYRLCASASSNTPGCAMNSETPGGRSRSRARVVTRVQYAPGPDSPKKWSGVLRPAARAGPRGHILAPYRDAEPLRRGEDDAAHRRVEAHVVVRVEVGRCAFHERQELLDLRPHLALDVLHRRALRRAARVTDESAGRIDQGARARERTAERQIDVEAQPESRGARRGEGLLVHVRRHEHGRARDDPVAVRGEDAGGHASRETEVVGVHDQPARHRSAEPPQAPWTTNRSTVVGTLGPRVASTSRARMWSRRS